MLKEIKLENFKPFGAEQTAPLSAITLIYGPNSGGKSSLIQSLMLMKQSIEGQGPHTNGLIPRGEYIDLGSFKSLLHKHDTKRNFSISVGYNKPLRRGLSAYLLPPQAVMREIVTTYSACSANRKIRDDYSELIRVQYKLNGGSDLNATLNKASDYDDRFLRLTTNDYNFKGYEWANVDSYKSVTKYLIKAHKARVKKAKVNVDKKAPTQARLNSILKDAKITTSDFLPSDIHTNNEEYKLEFRFFRYFEYLAYEYYIIFDSISYLGPLRSYPERHYLLTGGDKSTVGTRGQNTTEMIYRRQEEIEGKINTWFELFDIPYSLKVKAIGDEITGEIIALNLEDKRTKVVVSPSDVGFGIGQLLPIIAEGVIADKQIICVEQPEIHLHPRLQSCLADFFIETAGINIKAENKLNNQWIIETHSEQIILRIQKRIREGQINSSDISVLYVEPFGENGSNIFQLRLDDRGNFIDEWPGGFFDESYHELFDEVKSSC